jgi:hypothetical protein
MSHERFSLAFAPVGSALLIQIAGQVNDDARTVATRRALEDEKVA